MLLRRRQSELPYCLDYLHSCESSGELFFMGFVLLAGTRERDVLETYSRDVLLRRYRELQRYLSEVEQERERERLRDTERDRDRDLEREPERDRERWTKLVEADSVSLFLIFEELPFN